MLQLFALLALKGTRACWVRYATPSIDAPLLGKQRSVVVRTVDEFVFADNGTIETQQLGAALQLLGLHTTLEELFATVSQVRRTPALQCSALCS